MRGFHRAIYRPLPTIYLETGVTNPANWKNPQNAFDYIDPQFYPCSKTIPIGNVGSGHSAFGAGAWRTPLNAAALIADNWQKLTIRRVMCPSVPWNTITQLENRINDLQAWQPTFMTIPGLPNNTFPLGTIRFDSAEVIKRTLPTCINSDSSAVLLDDIYPTLPTTILQTWYDIVYKFSCAPPMPSGSITRAMSSRLPSSVGIAIGWTI